MTQEKQNPTGGGANGAGKNEADSTPIVTKFTLSFNTQYLDMVPTGCRKMPPGFADWPAAKQGAWWAKFNDGFKAYELELSDIIGMIGAGYPVAPGVFGEARRKKDNFLFAQSVFLDIDTGDNRALLSHLNTIPLITQTASFAYYTPGFTWAAPKSRIVWLLDGQVDDADTYEDVIRDFHHAVPFADKACKDAARFFFGSCALTDDGPDRFMLWGNVLNVGTWRRAFAEPRIKAEAAIAAGAAASNGRLEKQNDSGQPSQALTNARAEGLLRSLVGKVESQGPGKGGDGRHHACLRSVYYLAGMSAKGLLPLSEDKVKGEIYQAMVKNGSVKDHGQHNVTKTIQDAWIHGAANTADLKLKNSPEWEKAHAQ